VKIRVVGVEFSHADRWRHMTKLIFAFHSFAEMPKNPSTMGRRNLNITVTEWFNMPLSCRLLNCLEKP